MTTAKLSAISLLLAVSAGFTSLASADCAHKRAALEYQLQKAQQYGNTHRVAGLKRALSKTNAYCLDYSTTDRNSGAQRWVEKLEDKLRDKQEDIWDAQADLRKAQAKGDPRKVTKAQNKLRDKQAEANEIAEELQRARADLTG
ncbi:DUF1090 domain-containing protein [Pseudomonas nitroreducens]|uniref:DUF1090 domain-containing protein n=1 Tax=Pseudomonas TaxID=286 RepID=UPI0002F7F017|nr:DUF1090 domain-containing protein [Pseudomonas nitroreducens]